MRQVIIPFLKKARPGRLKGGPVRYWTPSVLQFLFRLDVYQDFRYLWQGIQYLSFNSVGDPMSVAHRELTIHDDM